MRILLFDWTVGGHHARYVREVARALLPSAEVVAAVPDEVAGDLGELAVEPLPLGAPRPALDPSRRLAPQHRALAGAELDLLERAIVGTRPDHAFHLYADPVIRRLVRRPPLPCPTSAWIFFPRAHYPRRFGTPLSPRERLRAAFLESLVARWRRRADAHALFTLDRVAAEGWRRRPGAAAHWLPEPPLACEERPVRARTADAVVYGALAPRKGIGLLADAVALAPARQRIVLAGEVEQGFGGELARSVDAMRAAGAHVDVRARRHTEREGLDVLAEARCAVLPYPRHYGMSRILVEAAAVGTPVVVHDFGLIGHLVREHRIGAAVDCTDPAALRAALATVAEAAPAVWAEPLARFATLFDPERFRSTLASAFGAPAAGRVSTEAGRA